MKPEPASQGVTVCRITGTIQAWSSELGMDDATIKKRLIEQSVEVVTGKSYTAGEVIGAVYNEREKAKDRIAMAEAEKQERENRVADGVLIDLPDARKEIWQSILLPLRQELENMPDALAALTNPENPDSAREVLITWVENLKKQIKEK